MNIDGKSRVYGLIGDPVEHTISPKIHNTLAERFNIPMCYVPFHVANGRLEDAIKGAYALNIQGMNVTVPYKTQVINLLNCVDSLALQAGAVNTLERTENGYKGYNTDIIGLERALMKDGIDPQNQNCVIIGAGGAARAAIVVLAKMGAKRIVVLNRTYSKAVSLVQNMQTVLTNKCCVAISEEEFLKEESNSYIAIHATKVGLPPNTEEVFTTNELFYSRLMKAYDLIPTARETGFVRECQKNNVICNNGLKMLLYQAVASFEIWNRLTVDENIQEEIYKLLNEG